MIGGIIKKKENTCFSSDKEVRITYNRRGNNKKGRKIKEEEERLRNK